MDSFKPVRKVFESEPGGERHRKGRPCQHLTKQVTAKTRHECRQKLAAAKTKVVMAKYDKQVSN